MTRPGVLRITRYTFGEEWVSLNHTKSGGVAYSQGNKYWLLDEERRELKPDEIVFDRRDPERGPFERADFGDRERLKWACGACAMRHEAEVTYWGQRYVLWFENTWLCVVDATRPITVRLALPIAAGKVESAMLHDGVMHLITRRDILVLAIADIEGLFERTSGLRDVYVREVYPLHRPDAKLQMVVGWSWGDTLTLEHPHGGYSLMKIPLLPGLDRGVTVTLYDAVAPGLFQEYSTATEPRRPLNDRPYPTEHAGAYELLVEPAVDPAGTLAPASAAVRGEDLDRVFGLLADEPDDEASRMVVVDLLEDAGEPYAATFARLLAGDETVRSDALGTLAIYISDIEWHGNLPRAGTLAATAPLDDEIGDLVMSDHRLGFFHTLRLGEGNFRLYGKLVASPRAVGLRHVDGSRVQILTALIAANRRELRRLSGVKFATREVIEALADPTFDRVVEIETETQASVVERLLDYIARDETRFFARAARHLVLVERAGNNDALVQPVVAAWQRLPLDRLTLGGVTIARDGTARAHPGASETIIAHVATRFRIT